MTDTALQVAGAVPRGRLAIDVTDANGNTMIEALVVQPPTPFDTSGMPDYSEEYGNREAIFVAADDGSNMSFFWPIDSVEEMGPITEVVGPKGTLRFRRAPESTGA